MDKSIADEINIFQNCFTTWKASDGRNCMSRFLLIYPVFQAMNLVTWEGGDPISATQPSGQPRV